MRFLLLLSTAISLLSFNAFALPLTHQDVLMKRDFGTDNSDGKGKPYTRDLVMGKDGRSQGQAGLSRAALSELALPAEGEKTIGAEPRVRWEHHVKHTASSKTVQNKQIV